MLQEPIIVIDFETTGLYPARGDRVTEVAALKVVGNVITDKFVTLVNSGVPIPAFVQQLTGITDRMIRSAPPAHEVIPALIRFISDSTIAAHNASFDIQFLRSECALAQIEANCGRSLCTMRLARRLTPGLSSYSLGSVARHLGLGFESRAHRAEEDARVAASVLLHLIAKLEKECKLDAVHPHVLCQATNWRIADAKDRLKKHLMDNAACRKTRRIEGRAPHSIAKPKNRTRRESYWGDHLGGAVGTRQWIIEIASGRIRRGQSWESYDLRECRIATRPVIGVWIPAPGSIAVPWYDIRVDDRWIRDAKDLMEVIARYRR